MGHETIAYTQEPSYAAAPGGTGTSYDIPGADISVSEISLDNAAERIRTPGIANAYDTVFQEFEGSISVEGTLTTGNTGWFQNVFASSASPYSFQTGSASSARWYIGADPGAGVAERELMGVVIPEASLSCEQGETVSFELTCVYGDESKNATLTQGSPIQPSGDPFVFHGGDLSVGGTSLALMQSATLSLNSQARLQRGWNRHPVDAVMGPQETELELERIFKESDSITGVGYGSSSSSAPTKNPDSASATLEFSAPGGSLTANLGGCTANEYNWSNAGAIDEDMMEGSTLYVNSPEVSVGGGA